MKKQMSFIEERDELIAELEIEKAKTDVHVLRSMRESWETSDWGWEDTSPPDLGGSVRPHYGARRLVRTSSSIYDRSDGRYLPFYETESDLARIRIQSRNLSTFTSVAIGAQQALANYVIGGEWQYTMEARTDATPPSVIEETQRFIDDFLDYNDFLCDLDREIHDSVREDGEALVALYPTANGMCRIVRLEPEQLVEPVNTRALEEWIGGIDSETSWTFGVHTQYDERAHVEDVRHPLGYHVIHDATGERFDYLPAWPSPSFDNGDGRCATHFKRNVTGNAKRGISDFWPLIQDLEREWKVTRNTAEGAAVQAAIAYIIENASGVNQSNVESSLSSNAIGSYLQSRSSGSTKTVQVERFDPGTVVRTGRDQRHHAGPLGSLRSPIFIEVAQFLMRRIGIRWSMPEYMISGDASNANFASALVSEAPFVKARQNDQRFFVRCFRKLMWKALKIAIDNGRFSTVSNYGELRRLVDLNIEPAEVASRDPQKLAQTNSILFDKGILDGETWASQAGLDPEKVVPPRGMAPTFPEPSDEMAEMSALQAAMEHVETLAEARNLVRDICP
jgi:hypothetical protein